MSKSSYPDNAMLERPHTADPVSAEPSLPATPQSTSYVGEGALHSVDQLSTSQIPLNDDQQHHVEQKIRPSPAQFPDPLMLCNKMIEFLKHLEPVYVLDILLFSNR